MDILELKALWQGFTERGRELYIKEKNGRDILVKVISVNKKSVCVEDPDGRYYVIGEPAVRCHELAPMSQELAHEKLVHLVSPDGALQTFIKDGKAYQEARNKAWYRLYSLRYRGEYADWSEQD